MAAMAFDTHASVKALVAAGMPEAQVEAVTALIGEIRRVEFSTLATKADLAETRADLRREIAEVRADLRQEIAEVRADLTQTRAELRQDIAEAKADILKWVIGMVAGAVVVNAITVIGAMLALVRIVGH